MQELEYQEFSEADAVEQGYDWGVVEFLMVTNISLLRDMWGSDWPYYQAILKNEISLDTLKLMLQALTTTEEKIGGVPISILLLLGYKEAGSDSEMD